LSLFSILIPQVKSCTVDLSMNDNRSYLYIKLCKFKLREKYIQNNTYQIIGTFFFSKKKLKFSRLVAEHDQIFEGLK
jgi:hypothetical protein